MKAIGSKAQQVKSESGAAVRQRKSLCLAGQCPKEPPALDILFGHSLPKMVW